MALRKEKKRTFDGHVYERAGQTTSHSKTSLERWAQFQRDVNGNDVRIVEENGGYEAYMRKGQKGGVAEAKTVTVRVVSGERVRMANGISLPKVKKTKIPVPSGDIVREGGKRHLRLY